MPRLTAIVQRAAQRASASSGTGSQDVTSSRAFCHYCLKPLLSETVRNRHVAKSPFCREAETLAIESAGESAVPRLERDYSAKTYLADCALDDMPAYVTDRIASAMNNLVIES